jgi:hypothetical protein
MLTLITSRWHFAARSDIVVTGTDPENADISNPRGESYGLQWFVQATNGHGDAYEQPVVTPRPEDAERVATRLAAALNTRMQRLGRFPVDFASWPPGRPVYGSPAYLEYGQDDDLATEARELEDEAWR